MSAVGGAWLLVLVAVLVRIALMLAEWVGGKLGWWEPHIR